MIFAMSYSDYLGVMCSVQIAVAIKLDAHH